MPMPKRDNTNICLRISHKQLQCLELFSTYTNLSKSNIVCLALNNYFMSKDEFRNNPKYVEIVGKEEIEVWKKANRVREKKN